MTTITKEIPDHILSLVEDFKAVLPRYDRFVSRSCGLVIYDPIVLLDSNNLHISPTCRLDSFVKLECGLGTVIGEYVHIASFCHLGIGGGVMILEDGTSFGSGAKIITGSNIPGADRGCSAIDPNAVIKKSFVRVRRNAVLFAGAIVLPGITIGEGAVIAAGAVVTKDVPDGETWAGVPARPVSKWSSKPAKLHYVNEPSPSIVSNDLFVQSMSEFYGWDRQ